MQHDKDYDKLRARGEEGTKALRTTSADERLLNSAKQIIEKNYKGEKQLDPYTNKPVSQETLERAKMVVFYFEGVVAKKKERIANGAKVEATPSK